MKQVTKQQVLLVSAIVVFGFVARLLPHFPNFAPLGAVALFAGAYYTRSVWAVLIPAMVWWLSDLYLNNFGPYPYEHFTWFTADQAFSLLSLALIAVLSFGLLKKITPIKVVAGSLSASLIFFLVSNFGVWVQGYLYPMNASGLATCYEMALPFYRATMLSDVLFSITFFGLMHWIAQKESTLAKA